jgi:hypothetical protein
MITKQKVIASLGQVILNSDRGNSNLGNHVRSGRIDVRGEVEYRGHSRYHTIHEIIYSTKIEQLPILCLTMAV